MKKQYIKPFMNVHTLKVETAVLAASFPVDARCYDRVDKNETSPQVMEEKNNYDLKTKWEWGNGNESEVN